MLWNSTRNWWCGTFCIPTQRTRIWFITGLTSENLLVHCIFVNVGIKIHKILLYWKINTIVSVTYLCSGVISQVSWFQNTGRSDGSNGSRCEKNNQAPVFIRPSSDGTNYGMVMSVRPTLRPSIRLSVRPFSALFSYMLWHIELKFCTWLCFTVLQIKFECRQFPSIFVGVMSLLELRMLKIHSFPHFSLTRFDILSWNFAYDFVLLYYWSSSSVINFRQFFLRVMPLLECRILKIQFSPLFSYTLWHIELKFCIWLCFNVLQVKFECHQFPSLFLGSYAPFGM